MNELKLFNYNGIQGVRVIVMNGKEPMFVARDVCDILELGDVSKAVSRLPETMKGTNSILTLGGIQEMLTVTEAGMYKLVFTSRKREAEKFTDWLATEVIPSIRKHGAYMTADTIEKTLTDPDYLIRLATRLKEEMEGRINAERQIEQDKPKVLFADAVSSSKTSILIGELAKILRQNGIEIGQNRLFDELRNRGYLIKRAGSDWNMPTQKSMELGLFEIKEHTHIDGNGCNITTRTPKCTGKGQQYFINKFLTA
jgi:anti-repressor protein